MSKTNSRKINPPPIVFILIGVATLITVFHFSEIKKIIFPLSSGKINLIQSKNELIASVFNVPSGTFRYSGSTSWAELRKDIHPIIELSFPALNLYYINPESGDPSSDKGIEMLLDGKIDFVQSSKGIPDIFLEKARQKSVELKEIKIAVSGFAIAVHPSLNIPGLTMADYQRIMKGEIKNWKELGGSDLLIHIYSTEKKSSENALVISVKTTTKAFSKIAKDPAGLHVASIALAVPQCGVKTLPIGLDAAHLVAPYNEPLIPASKCSAQNRNQVNVNVLESKAYPLLRNLSVVMIADSGRQQQLGETYAQMLLSTQGQELIRRAGYLNYQ
jgi:phosphate transport system substrate-binding protein